MTEPTDRRPDDEVVAATDADIEIDEGPAPDAEPDVVPATAAAASTREPAVSRSSGRQRERGYRGSLPPKEDRLARPWILIVIGIFVLIILLSIAGVPSRFIPDPTPLPTPSPAASVSAEPSGSGSAEPSGSASESADASASEEPSASASSEASSAP